MGKTSSVARNSSHWRFLTPCRLVQDHHSITGQLFTLWCSRRHRDAMKTSRIQNRSAPMPMPIPIRSTSLDDARPRICMRVRNLLARYALLLSGLARRGYVLRYFGHRFVRIYGSQPSHHRMCKVAAMRKRLLYAASRSQTLFASRNISQASNLKST